jgi:hypothetical protein
VSPTHFEYTQLKIGLGFAEVILNNANCQTVETFQRATSSYFGEGIAKKKVTYE